jgi:hypothetical protein
MARMKTRTKRPTASTSGSSGSSGISVTEDLPKEKRGRGRPKGSTVKNVQEPTELETEVEESPILEAKVVAVPDEEELEEKFEPTPKVKPIRQKALPASTQQLIESELVLLAHTLHAAQIRFNEGKLPEEQKRHLHVDEILSDIKIKLEKPSQAMIDDYLASPLGVFYFINFNNEDVKKNIAPGLYTTIAIELPLSADAGLKAIPDSLLKVPFGKADDWKRLVELTLLLNMKQTLYNQTHTEQPARVVSIGQMGNIKEGSGRQAVTEFKTFRAGLKLPLSPEAGITSKPNGVIKSFAY